MTPRGPSVQLTGPVSSPPTKHKRKARPLSDCEPRFRWDPATETRPRLVHITSAPLALWFTLHWLAARYAKGVQLRCIIPLPSSLVNTICHSTTKAKIALNYLNRAHTHRRPRPLPRYQRNLAPTHPDGTWSQHLTYGKILKAAFTPVPGAMSGSAWREGSETQRLRGAFADNAGSPCHAPSGEMSPRRTQCDV